MANLEQDRIGEDPIEPTTTAPEPGLSDRLYEEARDRSIRALVVDFETTGVDTDKDRIIQVGMKLIEIRPALTTAGWSVSSRRHDYVALFNPGMHIPPGASAVHHIVDETVVDAPASDDVYHTVKEWLLDKPRHDAVVGHNIIDFDLKFAPYLENGEFGAPVLDTLRLAKKAWPDMEKFSNQYLRYALQDHDPGFIRHLPLNGTCTNAHDALADCEVTAGIFVCAINALCDGDIDIAALCKLQMEPNLLKVMPFGKYRGKTFEEVSRIDRSYFRWALANMKDLDVDMRHTMTHYL